MVSSSGPPVLVVAAHPDDEVLGCGGTVARIAQSGRDVHVLLLADGETSRDISVAASGSELIEARGAAARKAARILGCASIDIRTLPDNRLDSMDLLDVIRPIEEVIASRKPSTVITHHAGDVNIDHRIVHNAIVTACRPQPGSTVRELRFFEIPSSTEWQPPGSALHFGPNLFVDITSTLDVKLEALAAYDGEMRAFPHARSVEAIVALARWRGATVGVEAAEAFVLGRMIL